MGDFYQRGQARLHTLKRSDSGQALLIVVLVMVVSLTIGLSVVSRSITNLRITKEEEQSQRAFSAAEAGVEQALKTGVDIADQKLENDATIKEVKVTSVGGVSTFLLNGGNVVPKDEGSDVWLSDNPGYGNPKSPEHFSIYWGSESDDCTTSAPAAIEAVLISGNKNNPSSTRYAFDPCSRGNNFTPIPAADIGSFDIGGKTLKYRTPIQANDRIKVNNGLILRIIPLYANTVVGIDTCNPSGNCNDDDGNNNILPLQAKKIESTGTSGTTTRKITVFQGFPKLPSQFFQYILFAP